LYQPRVIVKMIVEKEMEPGFEPGPPGWEAGD
jgi:hypothetical protein